MSFNEIVLGGSRRLGMLEKSTAFRVPQDVVLCGHLNPAAVLPQSPPGAIAERVRELLEATATNRNLVLSSGCDLPAGVPLIHLDAFHDTLDRANGGGAIDTGQP